MNIKINKFKIFVTVPEDDLDKVRSAVCEIGAGVIGDYTYCTTSTKSIGTFKPVEDANPYIGTIGKLEYVSEEKLEFVCDYYNVANVVAKIREVHPYEEPAIDIVPLLDEEYFENNERAKVITMCGSLRFMDKIMEVSERLEFEGNCVISLIYPSKKNKDDLTEEQFNILGRLHMQKIRMADAIYVVNVDGYIGKSVKKEIEYAKSLGKEIIYLEENKENESQK